MTEGESEPLYVTTIRRRRRRNPPDAIREPRAIYNLMHPLVRDLDREHFYCIHLNTRHVVLEIDLVSVGSLNASIVHPREVFRRAIERSAASIILAHNHPSGDPNPSEDDQEITRRLVKAGEILGIEVLDHLVLANGHFVSFRELGILS